MPSLINRGGLHALLLLALCVASCTNTPSKQVEVLVLLDQTEKSFGTAVEAQSIVEFLSKEADLNLTEVSDAGVNVTIAPLNEMRFNGKSTVSLPKGESGFTQIDKKRKEEQIHFQEQVMTAIQQVQQPITQRDRSHLVKPLVRELQQLGEKKADVKIVLLLSDLLEHNKALSFYQLDQKSIQTYLNTTFKKIDADLSGITIYAIYKPTNTRDDALFARVLVAWTEALSACGVDFKHYSNL